MDLASARQTGALRQVVSVAPNSIGSGRKTVPQKSFRRYDVEPLTLGDPVNDEPKRTSIRTHDPGLRDSLGPRSACVPRDRFQSRKPIVAGLPRLLELWPNDGGGLSHIEFTTFDSRYVYLTWQVPKGDDVSVWSAIAAEHERQLDKALEMSRQETEAWRPSLRVALGAALNAR